MTGEDWKQIVSLILSAVGLWISMWIAFRQNQTNRDVNNINAKSDVIATKVEGVHNEMNSQLAITIAAKVAEAVREERDRKDREAAFVSEKINEAVEKERTRRSTEISDNILAVALAKKTIIDDAATAEAKVIATAEQVAPILSVPSVTDENPLTIPATVIIAESEKER